MTLEKRLKIKSLHLRLNPVWSGSSCSHTGTHLLQDFPHLLVEADRDSVQGSIQTPPAQPLSLSGVLGNRNVVGNVQRLDGGQTITLRQGKRFK